MDDRIAGDPAAGWHLQLCRLRHQFRRLLPRLLPHPQLPRKQQPRRHKSLRARTQLPDNTLDPRLRLDILAASQNKKYEAGGRNIFRMEELKPIRTDYCGSVRQPYGPEPPPTPTPTPPPPPIPLKFYGFASKGSEPKRIFLADEGEVFVARQGDIVERKYKVIQINNTSVVIEDMLNSNRQTIQVTAK